MDMPPDRFGVILNGAWSFASGHLNKHNMAWIIDILILTVGYTVARLTIPFLSFDRINVEPLSAPYRRFNVLGYRQDEDGRIEIDGYLAASVGFVVCIIVFIAVGLLIRNLF